MNKHADIPSATTPTSEASTSARPRRMAQVLLALVLLAAGFAGYKTIMALAPQPKVRKAVEKPLPVRVLTVHTTSVRPAWTFYGTVQAARSTVLQLPVSGRIVWVSPSWRNGALVKQGEELLRIDDLAWRAAVAEAKAALVEARSRLEEARLKVASEQRLLKAAQEQFGVAEREFARIRQLVQRGTLPRARLDSQQASYLAAREKLEQRRHALAAARAALARAQAAAQRAEWAFRQAEDNLANTTLRAPFDGRLDNVQAEVGQQAGPSAQLAHLVGAAAPEVRFTMPEGRLAMLHRAGEPVAGRKVEVVLPMRTMGDAVKLPATIRREAAQVDEKQGAVMLFATLDDATQAAWLKPGMFVQVHMSGPLLKEVALLPEAAVHDGNTVYAVRDGRLVGYAVRILGMQDGMVIVSGLPAGVQVVRHRLAEPAPGKPARILAQG